MATNNDKAVVDPVIASEQDMIPSVKKVFGTTELLEAVLVEVDMRTLLLSQRTCKDFRDTINGSLKLQRALYFRDDAEVGSESEFNPLLALCRGAAYKCDFGTLPMEVFAAGAAFTNDNYSLPWTFTRTNLRRGDGDQLASWRRMLPFNHARRHCVKAKLYINAQPYRVRHLRFEVHHLTFGEILQTAAKRLLQEESRAPWN